MSVVPRRSKRAVGQDAEKPVNTSVKSQAQAPEPAANGTGPVEPLAPDASAAAPSPPSAPERPAVPAPAAEPVAAAPSAANRGAMGVTAARHRSAPDASDHAVAAASAPALVTAQDPGSNGHAVLPKDTGRDLAESSPARALPTPGPRLPPDPGLYAVLRLDPSASDAEIQTTYRRQAARLLGSGSNDIQALKQLNVAYEVLGNPVRRAEYDRLRLTPVMSVRAPTPARPDAKAAGPVKRRRRPRQAVQPRYAGLGDVLVVLMVVGLAVLAGVLIIPRLSINLSSLSVVQSVLPLSNNSARRTLEATATSVPSTPVPTATPQPGLAARFLGTSVSVSNPTPPRGSTESVIVRLRRDGQPAANVDVWSTVQYRTTEERWPATGAVKSDASGNATIAFNIGAATPNYPVTVHVFAQVTDQQLTWSTTFTPH